MDEKKSYLVCGSCGKKTDVLDKHHILPRSQGGTNLKENLISICKDCHYKIHHPDYAEGDIEQFNNEYKDAIDADIFSDGWGIIPNKILHDENISPGAKIVYCAISSLCAERGYCWATNTYIAGLFGISNATVSGYLTQLEKYLIFENRTSFKRRIRVHTLNKNARKVKENLKQPSRKLEGTPPENLKHNSTIDNSIKVNNNTVNIKKNIVTDEYDKELYDILVKSFYAGYEELYHDKPIYTPKDFKHIKDITNLVKGKDDAKDILHNKIMLLYQECKNDKKFWKFTPGKLVWGWNQLTGKVNNKQDLIDRTLNLRKEYFESKGL